MASLATDTAVFLSAGDYQFDFYSSGGAGTAKLQVAADGTNYADVADSSFTGSGQFILTAGEDLTRTMRWKVILTGDSVCNYFKVA